MTILIRPTNIPSIRSSVHTSHGKVFDTGGIRIRFGVMAHNTAVHFHKAHKDSRIIRVDLTIGVWFPDLDGMGCVAIVNE